MIFEVNSGVKLPIRGNLQDAYYFKAFKLDEWDIRPYMIIPPLHDVLFLLHVCVNWYPYVVKSSFLV